jgi:shikimate dehydrogenase
VRILNRTRARAEDLAEQFGDRVRALDPADRAALSGAAALVNASSAGLGPDAPAPPSFEGAPASAVVMDMTYRPLRTPFLEAASARGLRTVDGLDMLIGQAIPAFEAFFGQPPPDAAKVRGRVLRLLGEAS